LELFHDIIKQLPDADYMAVKFVCRSFYAATFYPDGRQVVDLKAKARADVAEKMKQYVPVQNQWHWWEQIQSRSQMEKYYMHAHHSFHSFVLTRLEAKCPESLKILTCVICGRRKAHGQYGFCDAEFDQKLVHRRCLDCRHSSEFGHTYRRRHSPSKVKINGIAVMRCGPCRRICPVSRRATRTGAAIPQHRCGQDLGLLK